MRSAQTGLSSKTVPFKTGINNLVILSVVGTEKRAARFNTTGISNGQDASINIITKNPDFVTLLEQSRKKPQTIIIRQHRAGLTPSYRLMAIAGSFDPDLYPDIQTQIYRYLRSCLIKMKKRLFIKKT